MVRAGMASSGSILVLILLFCGSYGQDSADEKPAPSVNDGQESGVTALEKGMKPFYGMTRTFLDLVIKEDLFHSDPTLFHLVLNITDSNSNNDGTELQEYINENWRSIMADHAGYAACIIVGILFIILMPIVGICFCCCRICGRCGGRVKPQEGRHHKCRQYTCGTILFLCNTVMLIGMVFAFMTNEQLRVLTTPGVGVVGRTRMRVESANNYVKQSVKELGDAELGFVENVESVIQKIRNIGRAASVEMNKETNATSLLEEAGRLATKLEEIEVLLENVDTKKTEIVSELSDLDSMINSWKDDADKAIRGCSTTPCDDLRTEIRGIAILVDYNQASLAIQNQLNKLRNLGDVKSVINNSRSQYDTIYADLETRVDAEIADVEAEKEKILTIPRERIRDIKGNITKFTQTEISNILKEIDERSATIEAYGTYEWYAGISLCCVFLLIILCYFLGLMFGVCGDPPYEDVNACNKGVGANLLLAGVGFCFLFSWLLMLVCTPLYATGQLLHTEACKSLSPNVSQSSYLESTYQPLVLSEGAMLVLDTYLARTPAFEKIVVSVTIQKCEQNKGIYEALQLENFYDIDSFDVRNYNVSNKLNELKRLGSSIFFGNVILINDEIRTKLDNIRDAQLDDLPLTALTDELNKQTLTKDLVQIREKVEQQRDVFSTGGDTASADKVNDLLAGLQTLQNELAAVQGKLGGLRESVDDLHNELNAQTGSSSLRDKVMRLKTRLEAAQTKIVSQGSTILQRFLDATVDNLYQEIVTKADAFKTLIKEDVGRCRPVYEILQGVINIVCVDVLNPFNGFWFSFGWILAFFIPSIISAVHLAGSYRKTEDYDPNDNKSFDEPNFDAYSGGIYPGDNIPLEDYHGRKAVARGGGAGLPNSAYVADRSPPPMPQRDYSPRDNYYRNGGPPAYPGHSGEGYGGRGAGSRGGPTPPNPPHYYNNRPARY